MRYCWLIESITSYGFKFGWVELILLTFESSPSVSVRVGEESLEDNLRISSFWDDSKDKIWILRCFELEYWVSKHGSVSHLKILVCEWTFS